MRNRSRCTVFYAGLTLCSGDFAAAIKKTQGRKASPIYFLHLPLRDLPLRARSGVSRTIYLRADAGYLRADAG
jgi:hypothetical protein